MAFKIALTPSYRVKVQVELPNERGTIDKSDFMAEFKRCDIDKLDELRALPQRDVVGEVLIGWSGLVDEANQEVPYSPAAREAVMVIPQALLALIEAFWASVYKAKQKN